MRAAVEMMAETGSVAPPSAPLHDAPSEQIAGAPLALATAHELNNVLMTVQVLTDIIDRRATDEETRRHVATLRRCVLRGKAVTDEILTGTRTPHLGVVDVRRWIDDTVAEVRATLPPDITLDVRMPEEELYLYGDQHQLTQVLVNLTSNARDAMPSGGSLIISCEACVSWDNIRFVVPSPDRYVHIKVRDTGAGIPANSLSKVFDARYTTKAHGNGIGLALAKQILQDHGGRIFAESTIGTGTVIHLFLPLTTPGIDATPNVVTREPRQQSSEAQVVLLVDDDLMITEALAAGLTREGRTIIAVNDLEAAQLVIEQWRPSHIVCDVHLSGPFKFEGLEILAHTRRHSPDSRLILITGDAPDALQMEASERGAVAFLQKPFETCELDNILNLVASADPSVATTKAVWTIPSIDSIVQSADLQPFFQPIVSLADHQHFGYEALARYSGSELLNSPELLFEYARRKDRLVDLELACMRQALHAAATLPGLLFMNLHPAVLHSSAAVRELLLEEARVRGLDRVVLEITEQASLPAEPSVFEDIDRLRDAGVRFAFDDVGIAYSHLPFIDRIKPSFLKISNRFGTAFHTDPAKTNIVGTLVTLAERFGCTLILEGIEDPTTALAARTMGIPYGQGFLFGHPVAAEHIAAP